MAARQSVNLKDWDRNPIFTPLELKEIISCFGKTI